ncbi:cyclopropane-fatty-acyl-phospholipid synthase [Roseiarcus fermentans]|uniref:Cyclopropane-fatty-acyl-phospholipid synthase n=1 Tax=Roseiarcus fermentans TaxID=1473586 RepID=A0A366EU84_9HYPH|nr:cyclopropane-fatty-acyl-phospholipid synthase family protein [Roseiarcus fermentans]RBP05055.1 cyclopropane-fatty-acyl-phospholipid synthase [Roseiarcus fermentans]
MTGADSRLASLKRLLADIHRRIEPGFGFGLWDGATVPETWPADGLRLAIADEGAVAALLKRPNITTFANLWAAGRIDLVNGSIFDLVARRPKGRTRELRKSLASLSTLRALLPFLFVPRGGPWPLEHVGRDRESDGSEGENTRNIAYHYDVSNAFYALWLDSDMVYTCAYFHNWSDDLDAAQRQKLDMTCRKLRLRPGDTLLDIGSGWGSLACHAAEHYGARVLGVTLSERQIALAREKAERRGLSDQVRFEQRDYALIEGDAQFDKIVSVGMFEHVGLANFTKYFETVQRLLKPGGLYLHHAITRPGGSHAARTGKKRPEFQALTRYIFPGGELDYLGRTIANLELAGFEVRDVECWREHYQRTTRFWHDRLWARFDEAAAEVGAATARVWLAYLAACSITFERNNAGVYQTLAMKRVRAPSGLPPTRLDLYR